MDLISQNNNTAGVDERSVIRVLPVDVVDRIAAGEVVQRAAAAIKELCENSLDANASCISVTVSPGKVDAFTVSDNGSGIGLNDLPLACTRHATSKLCTVDDLQNMSSYGFRGEALASISRVARVTITSKKQSLSPGVAYQMAFLDGVPVHPRANPIARTVGTTIAVTDLFYNLPSRQRLRPSEEYHAILNVLQRYALHCAATTGASISCQKQQKTSSKSPASTSDLQTAPFVSAVQTAISRLNKADDSTREHEEQRVKTAKESATKQVIVHAFGTHLVSLLQPFSTALHESIDENDKSVKISTGTSERLNGGTLNETVQSRQNQDLIYSCSGFVTALPPSGYDATNTKRTGRRSTSSTFILFVNNRLVDGCVTLQRIVQDVYTEFGQSSKTASTSPPWIYLSITVPPDTVDVNIHPTKRDVALLHVDRIGRHLADQLRNFLAENGHSFLVGAIPTIHKQATRVGERANNKRKDAPELDTLMASTGEVAVPQPAKQPKSMVRTNRLMPVGALEPFLVKNTKSANETLVDKTNDESTTSPTVVTLSSLDLSIDDQDRDSPKTHDPDCPLRLVSQGGEIEGDVNAIDLSLPGAFATAAARCMCAVQKNRISNTSGNVPSIVLRQPDYRSDGLLRLRRLAPTLCEYTSIQDLREKVQLNRSRELEKQFRTACFVGVVSHDRSLIQCEEQLVLLNHQICAEMLFYQLALNSFGGGSVAATLQGEKTSNETGAQHYVCERDIDVVSIISQFVQMEETLQHTAETDVDRLLSHPLEVSETNLTLAMQAGACLLQHSEMMSEYYSIRIEKNDHGRTLITGLPVLLEGYEPSPHGLPLFLLRLATEVDWTNEQGCFQGVCRELGFFFAHFPSSDIRTHATTIRHTIFPAVSALLVPSVNIKGSAFVALTSLPKLYRVFERC